MRGDRSTDPQSLVSRYGIGLRLATRVVALLSRRLQVTGTVLDAASQDAALVRLLLSPELLSAPDGVTEDFLRSRAADLGCADAELIRLVNEDEGWRTIALEDDLLADQARGEPAGQGDGAETGLVHVGPREMTLREAEDLFTPQEVARLKLSVLTSQDADERTESIRKIVFAPVDGGQKAGILLSVLIDGEADVRVRREAIRSLEQIGFRSDMAEALRGLFEEDVQTAIYAIQRLGALLQEADEAEAALSLAVVLEVLDQTKDARLLHQLLGLIGRCAHILVRNYQKTEQLVQSALRHLAHNFDQLRTDVEAALAACARQAPAMVEDLLWREFERSDDARARGLLLALCETFMHDRGRMRDLAQNAVDEILNPLLPESEKARLRYALVRLGEVGVDIALERLPQADPIQRSELVRLLDVLCTESDVSDDAVHRSVTALLELLKLADTGTRRIVLQATVLGDPRVEAALQQELASELLTLMGELNLPDTLGEIQHTLERIGYPALVPSYEFMRRAYPSHAAQCAAAALANILREHGPHVDDELAGSILAVCDKLLDDETNEHGAFVLTMAGICGYTRLGARRFDDVLTRLKAGLWRLPYPMEVLDALGLMAGSDNALSSHQQELFDLFDAIVQFVPRNKLGRREETEDGVVFMFGREMEFDTRLLPSAVRGLERICISRQASADMRTDIAKRLLILWEGVSKVRIVWGPFAVEALVSAMCSAACVSTATVDTKVRLGTSLLRVLNKISVIRSIGQICSQPHASRQMRDLVVQAGAELLNEWEECERQDIERRVALLVSAGTIAANPSLGAEDEDACRLRERALQALFSGLRDGLTAVRQPLLQMRECPALSPAQKGEIDERLSRAFGLVRSSGAR